MGIIGLLLLVGLPLFIILFPRRPIYEYTDESRLSENAKITRVFTKAEGSYKHRRIRTHVIFNDGFTYSACCDSRDGLFSISADEEAQLEVVERALKKHAQIVKKAKENLQSKENLLYKSQDCSEEEKLKNYITFILEEKSKPQELLDLYWQYKKYVYGYYPKQETKKALEKVIMQCTKKDYEGHSQLMISVAKEKISKL